MLDVEKVSLAFGGVYANRDVTLSVAKGELRGIIGPNGAGKSTLLNLISGHLRPQSGRIAFGGERVDTLPPHRRARLGMAIVFQGARVFPGMSVLENVMVGATAVTRSGAAAAALRLPRERREEVSIRESARAALDRVGMSEWADRDGASLPLGQQRRMQFARALAAEPKLLLLDEPASGLRASERDALAELLAQLKKDGVSIVLIEHDVPMVMRVADWITVLDLGEVISEGAPDLVRQDPRVIAAYLGSGAADASR
jgi:branched-chain amino acid transport system ATP-binding protein